MVAIIKHCTHYTNTNSIMTLNACLTLIMPSLTESCVESSWSDCVITILFGSIFLCFTAIAFAATHKQVLRYYTVILLKTRRQ